MKKQKHYHTEEQIIEKIDAARADADHLNTTAELNQAQAHENLKQSQKLLDKWQGKKGKEADEGLRLSLELKDSYFTLCDNAIKCRKRAKRIEEVKLAALGEALSEFRTQPIVPVLGNDVSVASLV